jgi:NadR type nicotinamide-nucleotide adenylyltransferase
MRLGFVVGKFYPPHKGHKHLIDTARRQVDRLVVLLAHHPSQKIPGELRQQWLQRIHPDCEIHLVPDELDDDSQQWANFTIRHLERAPDVVFSSEDYGPRFAAYMGCEHVMVDRARQTVPVSGTLVRAAPLDHLEMLEPCVRAWFVRRVVLIGAESTGKTTLAQRLAEHLETVWVPEYGREYWEIKAAGCDMAKQLPGWNSQEFVHIAAEQQRRENELAERANKVLICDTNAFATGTWHERYLKTAAPRSMPSAVATGWICTCSPSRTSRSCRMDGAMVKRCATGCISGSSISAPPAGRPCCGCREGWSSGCSMPKQRSSASCAGRLISNYGGGTCLATSCLPPMASDNGRAWGNLSKPPPDPCSTAAASCSNCSRWG